MGSSQRLAPSRTRKLGINAGAISQPAPNPGFILVPQGNRPPGAPVNRDFRVKKSAGNERKLNECRHRNTIIRDH
jgi:hypothetical protein